MLKSFIKMASYLHINYTHSPVYFKLPLDYLSYLEGKCKKTYSITKKHRNSIVAKSKIFLNDPYQKKKLLKNT